MRVLLINPYYPISETPSPPLGLAFLAGALERAGHEVNILDLVVYPFSQDRLATLLQDFRPDLVGATAVTMTVDNALMVLEAVKVLQPAVPTVVGGPHATFCAAQVLQSHPQVDIVARGEGEHTLVALARAIDASAPWAQVPGITFRHCGGVTETPLPPPADLNELAPPSRHRIPLGRYLALGMPVSMTTSRGCPFKCIFCVGRKMVGARVRYRDPSRVVDEMAELNRMGFHQINLADDLFTASESHCLAVCDAIIKRRLEVKWTSFARVDTVNRTILDAMHRAGCTTVSFGVESGSPEMLRRIRKGITLDQVEHAVKLCLECGIDPHASFILGLPGESEATIDQTVDFGKRLKALGVSHGFHILAPFPGTEVRECIDRYDLQILSDDWRLYHANRAVVRTMGVEPKTFDEIVIDTERQFDRWLGEIGSRREKGAISDADVWPLVRLEHTVVLYDMMMKRLVEEKGFWPADPEKENTGEAMRRLIDRVEKDLDHPPGRIQAAIEFATRQNHLRAAVRGGQLRWSWVEFL